ncbi:zinc ABC transporter substrate-binding protein [Protaetiibacter sp. SSC-01]|uniref:metal ABC transporter solute-binding protein, Zn/Mn family n=1 Tax=Protaetiibacter sp. SSC-01 TaxID=2759943 RepID=UPI0016572CC0|nr:zinc ABC transporter substrate-binding protein [Protaetiibacter sp. SSC-01]QNO38000.1 zinc ABC transporter substrate-binding protein [Protaetiibacter sp. SSC-01]
MLRSARAALPAVLMASALTLAGCAPDAVGTGDGDDPIRIVASTNVYGDVAATIAGDAAEVTSIIHDAAQDPHDYEATPRDALALSEADLVIVNGGGYDAFMGTLLDAHGGDPVVLDAVELADLDVEAGHDHGHDHDDHDHAVNEHVWYDLHVVELLAEELAEHLAALDPANAETFAANAADFVDGVGALEATASAIAEAHSGARVAITEPVPLYLLEAAGLENATPPAFSEAIEEGTDAPALVLRDVEALVSDGSVAFLAYNAQTVGPQTEAVLAAATGAGTPVVSFSELLPEGDDYLGWMAANLAAIEAALT